MSRASGRTNWLVLACLAAFVGIACLAAPSAAEAEETVWICKPGQADDLCAGSIETTAGDPPQTVEMNRPERAPVDCFYVYPTVSEQKTPNANLDKDPEVRRVVVQQARMFSRVCDVYAPMYRQETSPGIYTEATEVAYQSALSGWKDYLRNHNRGRGVILVGHSQGSATLGRLIDEEIDPNPVLRKRLVGAILPGANIHVPRGELVGGMYDHVPVCSEAGQYGCLVAFSIFNGEPADNPPFGDLGSGYWAYKIPRPDRTEYEAVCADPAALSGEQYLTPLINMDYLLAPPADGVEKTFWRAFPDAGVSACTRKGTKHWLDVQFNGEPDPFLEAMIPFVTGNSNNWHVPEVNVAEENLIRIAGRQTASYLAEARRVANLRSRIRNVGARLRQASRRLAASRQAARRLARRARQATPVRRRALVRRANAARRTVATERKRIRNLRQQTARLRSRIG